MAVWLAVVASVALGQDDDPETDMELSVKPRLCIIDHTTPACDVSLLVSWASSLAGDYCLFNSHIDESLSCWRDEKTGEYADERVVDDELHYWMNDERTEAQLAAVTVEVLRMDDDDRRRRRRSRHVWDVL